MDKQIENIKEIQKLLQDELEKYKDSKKNYKPYMQCADEISVWLQEAGK